MDGIKNLQQQLIEKKDGITQSMNLHRKLVSGILRLPTEVLSHIFVHCFLETSYISPPSKTLAPMLLTRICPLPTMEGDCCGNAQLVAQAAVVWQRCW